MGGISVRAEGVVSGLVIRGAGTVYSLYHNHSSHKSPRLPRIAPSIPHWPSFCRQGKPDVDLWPGHDTTRLPARPPGSPSQPNHQLSQVENRCALPFSAYDRYLFSCVHRLSLARRLRKNEKRQNKSKCALSPFEPCIFAPFYFTRQTLAKEHKQHDVYLTAAPLSP